VAKGRIHLARGAARSRESLSVVRAAAVLVPSGTGGFEGPRCGRRRLQRGGKSKRVSAGGSGATRADVNGLAERNKASKRVKSSQRDGNTGGRPEEPGSALRRVERDLIVVGGSRQPRSIGRGRLTKPAVTRRSQVRLGTAVDDRKGASGLERGARLFARGRLWRRDEAWGGCGTKQGREARVCQETAERLRKPESGTGVGVTACLGRG